MAARRTLLTGVTSTALLAVAFIVPAQAVGSPAAGPVGPTATVATTAATTIATTADDVLPRAPITPRLAEDAHPDHLYSWPSWYPLRDSGARSSCVKTNCPGAKPGQEHYHGKWAIDWNVPKVDAHGNALQVPVFAAGHGIAHIGGRSYNCATDTGSTKGRGNWAWIDHGGGIVTLYYHLDTFAPGLDGAAVTPRTRIGYAGSTGSPCRSAKYLHFEVKSGGIQGTSINMGQLSACMTVPLSGSSVNTVVQLPAYLGYSSWDHLPSRPNPPMPHTNKSCIPSAAPATLAAPAAPAVGQSGQRTTVSWTSPPPGAIETMVGLEKWSATVGGYRAMTYHSVSATATTQSFDDLVLGGRYRIRLAHRNGAGWSNWSSTTEVAPALPPNVPEQVSATSGITWIRLDWARPANNGAVVTGYVVEREVLSPSGTWGPVESITTTASDMRWNDVRNQTFRLRVRALSNAGPSDWSDTFTISAVAPDPPDVPGGLTTSSGRTWIRFDWTRPANNGTPVTGYTVSRSILRPDGTWTGWRETSTLESDMRWNDLRGSQTFRLMVRALSAAGPSGWSGVLTVSTTG
jgi:hypothetical protein